jgi:hypothetical protein
VPLVQHRQSLVILTRDKLGQHRVLAGGDGRDGAEGTALRGIIAAHETTNTPTMPALAWYWQ